MAYRVKKKRIARTRTIAELDYHLNEEAGDWEQKGYLRSRIPHVYFNFSNPYDMCVEGLGEFYDIPDGVREFTLVVQVQRGEQRPALDTHQYRRKGIGWQYLGFNGEWQDVPDVMAFTINWMLLRADKMRCERLLVSIEY